MTSNYRPPIAPAPPALGQPDSDADWSPAGRALVDAFAPQFSGPDRLERMAGLAELMCAKGLRADALRLGWKVLAESPRPSLAGQRIRQMLSAGVADWHPSILTDQARLEAYERAIRAAVSPGALVLDIGTGTGILAMMAARAGAELVVACERNDVLAALAEKVVARNGLSDRIRVVMGDSAALCVGVELPRRADVVVSEICSTDLFREGVIPTMQAARRDLMTESTLCLPRRASVRVALVRWEKRFRQPITTIGGFDLSQFDAVSDPLFPCGRAAATSLLSDDGELFNVDLTGRSTPAGARTSVELRVREAGDVVGILQWLDIELGDGITLGTGPGSASTNWGQSFAPLREPLAVVAGQAVTVHGWHNQDRLLVWL